jgi:hypothetical protein
MQRGREDFGRNCGNREVRSYVATPRAINRDIVWNLTVHAIEARFRSVEELSQGIEQLSNDGPAHISRDTQNVADTIGLAFTTTPYCGSEPHRMAGALFTTFTLDHEHAHPLCSTRLALKQLPR